MGDRPCVRCGKFIPKPLLLCDKCRDYFKKRYSQSEWDKAIVDFADAQEQP